MSKQKLRGFTLIELLVVIAIIGVLAVILVPSMMGYVKMTKIRRYNSNSATVFKGAQLACVDLTNAGGYIPPSTAYINDSNGDFECKDSNGNIMNIQDYVGSEFKGYFGFMTDQSGSGCAYAMWSEDPITADMLQSQMSESDVRNTFYVNGKVPRGCHPLKSDNADDDDN